MLESLAIFLVKRRVAVIVVMTVVTLVFMHFMYELRINENFEESIYRGDLAYDNLRSTMDKLGHDDMILVAVECGDVLDERNEGLIRELHGRLEALPSVRRVVSLANAEDLVLVEGELSYQKLTEAGTGRSRESIAADIRERFLTRCKRRTIVLKRSRPWWSDSDNRVSGRPGAVH